MNNKLNYQPKEEDDVNIIAAGAENTFKKYEEELEINDFPQQARWKVTSKVCTYCSSKSKTLFLREFDTIPQQSITKNKNAKIFVYISTGGSSTNIRIFGGRFNGAWYVCSDG